jgi:two-component system sensor histidine kinase SenX3
MVASLAALAGFVVGAIAMVAVRPRGKRRSETVVTPDSVLPQGVASVLAVLPSSAVVLDRDDRVLRASSAARAFGLVKGDHLMAAELLAVARQVRRDGEIRESEFEVAGRKFGMETTNFAVRVAPLGTHGQVLVLAEDQTERRRVEAARLTYLVQDLITLSRIQGGEPIPTPGCVPVDEVLHEAIDRCNTKASAKDIALVAGGTEGLRVWGDDELLVTALRNLIDNAVAYSPESTRVVVSARPAGEAIEVSVSDQGIGIPESSQERIFERFFRVDAARSRATGGTGLGLAIVKHVAVAHGGEVTVWSKEGSGSTFTLRLPAFGGMAIAVPSTSIPLEVAK